MAKVFISPSNQKANKYAYGNYTEDVVCGQIAQACKTALERCGITVGLNHYGTLKEKCDEANNGYNVFVSIHSNSYDDKVSGTRIFTYGNGVNETRLAQCIFDVLSPFTPGTSENIQPYPELYELRMTKMAACLVEVDFHSVPNVAKWLVENTEEIGEKIAEGIAKYCGIKYVDAKTNNNKIFYQCVAGSFSNKANAESRIKALKSAGFDAFIQVK
jgi:N-acetylmuramoyl-L-alanine amidase